MANSRLRIQSEKNFRLAVRGGGGGGAFRRNNRSAISGLHPTVRERHGPEQRSAIALKLIFGYINCRPSSIMVKYSIEGVAILY